jgi:hypothetical protein
MNPQCHASKEKLRIVRRWLKCEESVSEPYRRKGLTLIVVIVLLWGGLANAQNLVPNPSFEAFSQCPNTENDFNGFVDNWIRATFASPDYSNACNVNAGGCFTDVPNNFGGFQAARTGDAYAGLISFMTNPNHTGGIDQREYIEVELTQPLVAGAEYRISFYVSLADASNWVIQEIGAFVSVNAVTGADALPSGGGAGTGPIPVVPQVEHSGSFLDDADNWTLLSGTFTATGGEKWLVIGNFHSDTDTTRQARVGSGGLTCGNDDLAYYYVDDVSLPIPDFDCFARTPGFWHRVCTAVLGKSIISLPPGSGLSEEEVLEALDKVAEDLGLPDAQTVCGAVDASPGNMMDPARRASRQIVALELNVASGLLSPFCGIDCIPTFPAPECTALSVTYEILHADCNFGGGQANFDLLLNGQLIGNVSSTQGCECNSNPLSASFNDAATLALLDLSGGPNTFEVITNNAQFLFLGQVRVTVEADSCGAVVCVMDGLPGITSPCADRDFCDASFTDNPPAVSTTVTLDPPPQFQGEEGVPQIRAEVIRLFDEGEVEAAYTFAKCVNEGFLDEPPEEDPEGDQGNKKKLRR